MSDSLLHNFENEPEFLFTLKMKKYTLWADRIPAMYGYCDYYTLFDNNPHSIKTCLVSGTLNDIEQYLMENEK